MKSVFIGSTKEALSIARKTAATLEQVPGVKTKVWEDCFESGDLTLEKLESLSKEVDGAVFLATPDDKTIIREKEAVVPRANVVFEYALFTALLSRKRVAVCLFDGTTLPSDLHGLTSIRMGPFVANEPLNAGAIARLIEWAEKLEPKGPVEVLRTGLTSASILSSMEIISSDGIKTAQSEVVDLLDGIRTQCFEKLAALAPNRPFRRELLRANLFLPEGVNCQQGFMYELCLKPEFSVNMRRQAEWGLRFHPGEGAVGTAFSQGKPFGIQNRDEHLSARHKDIIHPDLKWVLSVPIKGKRGAVLAVLNVDGLEQELDLEFVDVLLDLLKRSIPPLSELLDGFPRKRIFTVVSA